MNTRKHNPRNEKPISLNPLSLEEALGKAMNVIPPEKYSNLVKLLSGIRINSSNRSPANMVASDLVDFVLKKRSLRRSEINKQQLKRLQTSGNCLWDGYKRRLKLAATQELAQSHEEAAGEAIAVELNYLEQTLDQPKDGSSPD